MEQLRQTMKPSFFAQTTDVNRYKHSNIFITIRNMPSASQLRLICFLVLEKPINGLGSQAASTMKYGPSNENTLNENDHELIIRSSDHQIRYVDISPDGLIG